MVEPKHAMDFVKEDRSLHESHTVEEYEAGIMAANMNDCSVEEAFDSYKNVMDKLR